MRVAQSMITYQLTLIANGMVTKGGFEDDK